MSIEPNEQVTNPKENPQGNNEQKPKDELKQINQQGANTNIDYKKKTKLSNKSIRQLVITLGVIAATSITARSTIRTAEIAAQLTERDNEMKSLRSQLEMRDVQILDLQTKINEQDKEIATLKNQINNPPNPLTKILSQGSGDANFEWQWAGENWYGRVTLQKQGESYLIPQAKVGLLEKNIEDRFLMNGQVLNLVDNAPGTFEITDNGIRIEIPVIKKDRRTNEPTFITLKGALKQTLCYAGRLGYLDGGGLYQGDMVLVDLDYGPIYASQLDDWFLNEQAWFDQYYIDRDK
jgi:hypothetical protein